MTEERMNIAGRIDHTNLKTDCTQKEIEQLCIEAKQHGFVAVCVPPYFVVSAGRLLKDTKIKIATVIGYPLGFAGTFAKVEEIKRAIDEGADELDVVINIAAVRDKNWNHINSDIDSCVSAVHMRGKIIKVILETSLLTEEEIIKMCEICTERQVDYIKTSTGKAGGATLKAVELLRKNLPTKIKIKASGGIRDLQKAMRMIEVGADRLGSSSGVAIVGE
ncbi:MAG: deoxyribose-phosphate aldolase [Saprospiraceae bacterium]|jgi:deoxyribose-phosphate aldolase